jgi:hypothetical protein
MYWAGGRGRIIAALADNSGFFDLQRDVRYRPEGDMVSTGTLIKFIQNSDQGKPAPAVVAHTVQEYARQSSSPGNALQRAALRRGKGRCRASTASQGSDAIPSSR